MCNSLVNANVPVDEGVVIVTVSLLLKLEIVLFVNSLVVAEKYVSKSVTATWTIVPSSFKTTLSSSTTVVEVAVVSPSNTFNSVAVDVTNVLPNIRPFIPSCDAIVKSFSPSWIVTPPFTVKPPSIPTVVILLLPPQVLRAVFSTLFKDNVLFTSEEVWPTISLAPFSKKSLIAIFVSVICNVLVVNLNSPISISSLAPSIIALFCSSLVVNVPADTFNVFSDPTVILVASIVPLSILTFVIVWLLQSIAPANWLIVILPIVPPCTLSPLIWSSANVNVPVDTSNVFDAPTVILLVAIVVLSIVPPSISTLLIFTSPLPFGVNDISPFTPSSIVIEPLFVPLFVLSNKSPVPHVVNVTLLFSSPTLNVSALILTLPLPCGVNDIFPSAPFVIVIFPVSVFPVCNVKSLFPFDWNTPVAEPVPADTIPFINTVPSIEFVIVWSFSNIIPPLPLTSILVLAVIVVKAPLDCSVCPIAVLSIVPPSISTVSEEKVFPVAIETFSEKVASCSTLNVPFTVVALLRAPISTSPPPIVIFPVVDANILTVSPALVAIISPPSTVRSPVTVKSPVTVVCLSLSLSFPVMVNIVSS